MTYNITQADRDCLKAMMRPPENCPDVSLHALQLLAQHRNRGTPLLVRVLDDAHTELRNGGLLFTDIEPISSYLNDHT